MPLKIPPHELTEAQYLDRQAQQAKDAMGRVADQIKALAREAADPRPYVEQYPWISMGAAAVVGFLAGTMVTPARGQSLGERLSSLMPAGREGAKPKSPVRFITTPLIRMARTALISALSGATASKVKKQEQSPTSTAPARPYAGPPVTEGGEAWVSTPT